MPNVEIEIGDYGDEVIVIVRCVEKNTASEFYFDNDDDANDWINSQKFSVIKTHFS